MILIFTVLLSLLVGTTTADDNRAILDVPGQIAYIGSDYNVYTISLRDDVVNQLTDDASSLRQYLYPTWAEDNRLAYFCCVPRVGMPSLTEVFISQDGIAAGDSVYTGVGEVYNYAYWSPQTCAIDATCRDLAVLIGRAGSLAVDIFRNSQTETTAQTIGTGGPFYFSWSPDGRRMLLQRNNRRFDILDLDKGELERLDATPGAIQAPSWSPVDDRLLIGIRSDDGTATDLAIISDDQSQIIADELPGLVSYNWSPDGNYVAYRTIFNAVIGSLVIADSVTGAIVSQTRSDEVVAFFWSPDSKSIAYTSLSTSRGTFSADGAVRVSTNQQDTIELAWSVLDVETGAIRRYSNFRPTDPMLYVFTYFDQFAQSHHLWSPDSTHLVFSEITPDGSPVINVLDMTRPDTVPFYIADGVLGIWSFH